MPAVSSAGKRQGKKRGVKKPNMSLISGEKKIFGSRGDVINVIKTTARSFMKNSGASY